MTGITINELYDYLSSGHEISFIYNGSEFSIEPDKDNSSSYVTIWDCGNNARCLCRCIVSDRNNKKEAIDNLLSAKCFDGKSFMEIEKDVIVDVIY